ncbi:MAG: N-acetylmuramoyl-L-alanine amidase [Epsilonproteobacteria bacterium]|nr:N-acetylmuramoyl-L-alanine amidase [Campylobacterota bacterium]
MQKPCFPILLIVFSVMQSFALAEKIIIINPAGDGKKTGRELRHGYERAQTFKCAQKLKNQLLLQQNCKVLLTRNIGEEVVPWQNASFANRMLTDIFISIHITTHRKLKPCITFYQITFDPHGDFIKRSFDSHSFMPVHQTHLGNTQATRSTLNSFCKFLRQGPHTKQFDCHGPYAIPFKPLVGIQAPLTFGIELCLSYDEEWSIFIEPLVMALEQFLSSVEHRL